MEIVDSAGKTLRSIEGEQLKSNDELVWDGKADSNGWAAQGEYYARLTIQPKEGTSATYESEKFLCDIDPPQISLSIEPSPVVLTSKGSQVLIRLEFQEHGASVNDWRADIVSKDGTLVKSFVRAQFPDNRIVWDGTTETHIGLLAQSNYDVKVRAYDEWGNRGETKTTFSVVQENFSELQTLLKNFALYFAPNSSRLENISVDMKKQNVKTLDRIAQLLAQYPQAKIRITGHANKVFWFDTTKAQREQEKELVPLSRARAQEIRRQLIQRGIPESQLYDEGIGAQVEIVSFQDRTKNWMNRRVDFSVFLVQSQN